MQQLSQDGSCFFVEKRELTPFTSEKYFEIPFSINTDEGVLSGQIDLVYKEKDGWVIVDYKTDNFEKDPERKKAYQKQLDIYAKYWQELTKEQVKDRILYQIK